MSHTPPRHRRQRLSSAKARRWSAAAMAAVAVFNLGGAGPVVAVAPASNSYLRPDSFFVTPVATLPEATAITPVSMPVDVPVQNVPALNTTVPAAVGRGPGVGASFSDIPSVALAAYQHAEQAMAVSDPGCHLGWALLAAIGYVESDHGHYGGNHLDARGNEATPLLGVVLDGSGGNAAVPDGAGGFQRAQGPMQFLPGTWAKVGADGDHNGDRNIQNIFDAALGAGVYLCLSADDLSNPVSEAAAILRYNHSASYVQDVQTLEAAYQQAQAAAATAPIPTPGPSPSATPPALPSPLPRAAAASTAAASPAAKPSALPATSPTPSPSVAPPSSPMAAHPTVPPSASAALLSSPTAVSASPSATGSNGSPR